jgi:hypothetical protein
MPKECFRAFAMRLMSIAALASVQAVSAAPLAIERSAYTLTLPDGWTALTILPDSAPAVYVKQTTTSASAWIQGDITAPSSMEWMISSQKSLNSMDHILIDSATPTIGGKSFVVLTWKEDPASSFPDSTARLRSYTYRNGVFIFQASLDYNLPEGGIAVTQFEEALATLRAKPISIRPIRPREQITDAARFRIDVLGRNRSEASGRPAGLYFALRP